MTGYDKETLNTLIDISDKLRMVISILDSMKQQEYEYWEAWKQAKAKESVISR